MGTSSDRSGEEQIWVMPAAGDGPPGAPNRPSGDHREPGRSGHLGRGYQEAMRKLTMFTAGLVAALGLSFTAVGIASEGEATAQAAPAAGTISIDSFQYNPAELAATVGQPITITNNDEFPHTVTAQDSTFDVEVPAKGSATVTVPKAGSFPYTCTFHPGQHNPATINAS